VFESVKPSNSKQQKAFHWKNKTVYLYTCPSFYMIGNKEAFIASPRPK